MIGQYNDLLQIGMETIKSYDTLTLVLQAYMHIAHTYSVLLHPGWSLMSISSLMQVGATLDTIEQTVEEQHLDALYPDKYVLSDFRQQLSISVCS